MNDSQVFFNIMALIGTALGVPGIITILLQRKGANKKLDIEEGGLEVTQFSAIIEGYKQLLADESSRRADQTKAIAELRGEMNDIRKKEREYERTTRDLYDKLSKLRGLMLRYVKRTGIDMTAAELDEFEQTKPNTASR